jgi:hypothetical protein
MLVLSRPPRPVAPGCGRNNICFQPLAVDVISYMEGHLACISPHCASIAVWLLVLELHCLMPFHNRAACGLHSMPGHVIHECALQPGAGCTACASSIYLIAPALAGPLRHAIFNIHTYSEINPAHTVLCLVILPGKPLVDEGSDMAVMNRVPVC